MTRASEGRLRKLNKPPPADDVGGWGWMTGEMLNSPAFRALTPNAMRALMRIWLEHIQHAGTENGNLPVTYDDFQEFGIRRHSIKPAIDCLVKLGWIDVATKGRAGKGIGRAATRYRLTWLPTPEGDRATNRWKNVSPAASCATRGGTLRLPPTEQLPEGSIDSSDDSVTSPENS